MHRLTFAVLLAGLVCSAAPVAAQQPSASRDSTREHLRVLLVSAGDRADINASFRISLKQPYNFIGWMTRGLVNSDTLEIVLSVTTHETIGLRVYPHYKGHYINLDKVTDGPGLMRQIMHYNNNNFLFWGADADNDVFSGYTVTLESGFPTEAILVVLRSIRSTDQYIGEMRPFIDGSAAAPHSP